MTELALTPVGYGASVAEEEGETPVERTTVGDTMVWVESA